MLMRQISDKRQAAAVAKLKLQQEQQKQKAANIKSAKGSKSQLQKQKQQSRSEWFDPEKYDTKQIRHPPPVKKVLPAGAEIYCRKCNEVFDDVSELTAHEKTCYVGRHYKCPQPGCSHVTVHENLCYISTLKPYIIAIHSYVPFVQKHSCTRNL